MKEAIVGLGTPGYRKECNSLDQHQPIRQSAFEEKVETTSTEASFQITDTMPYCHGSLWFFA